MAQGSTRTYRMAKRKDNVEETRRRIVAAAVDLHGTVGPAETTISAVADKAGVQRSTVYRHFPDEEALFGACTSHWLARHPWPGPDDWRSESDPVERLRLALRQLYRYYSDNHDMLLNSYRDIDVMPAFVVELMRAQLEAVHSVLWEPWRQHAPDRMEAALGHAVDFRSCLSLTGAGLTPEAAAELMTDMVTAIVDTAPSRS